MKTLSYRYRVFEEKSNDSLQVSDKEKHKEVGLSDKRPVICHITLERLEQLGIDWLDWTLQARRVGETP
jgi:hypothetical protein